MRPSPARRIRAPSPVDAARADAVDYLAQSIVKGSIGVWGSVPMPANTQLTSAEAHTLAQWVMSLH
jgi:cytochrome c